jgi:hypothetical protein
VQHRLTARNPISSSITSNRAGGRFADDDEMHLLLKAHSVGKKGHLDERRGRLVPWDASPGGKAVQRTRYRLISLAVLTACWRLRESLGTEDAVASGARLEKTIFPNCSHDFLRILGGSMEIRVCLRKDLVRVPTYQAPRLAVGSMGALVMDNGNQT